MLLLVTFSCGWDIRVRPTKIAFTIPCVRLFDTPGFKETDGTVDVLDDAPDLEAALAKLAERL